MWKGKKHEARSIAKEFLEALPPLRGFNEEVGPRGIVDFYAFCASETAEHARSQVVPIG
jgi:hypothetical protein